MARPPRLALAGHAHLVSLYGHSAQPVFIDDDDRRQFLAALREAALQQQVAVHAYVLLEDHVHLLLTPATAAGLGALMQVCIQPPPRGQAEVRDKEARRARVAVSLKAPARAAGSAVASCRSRR